jgi:hypothetical protein
MARKTKQTPEPRLEPQQEPSLPECNILLLKHTPARLVGWVKAANADEAIATAIKEFKVSNSNKLIAVRRR